MLVVTRSFLFGGDGAGSFLELGQKCRKTRDLGAKEKRCMK